MQDNETLDLLLNRSSCRSFSDKKIPDEVLNKIFEAGIQSPTGGNLQPYSIIKIENKDTNEKLCKLCGDQKFIAKAPVNLIFCIDFHRLARWASLEYAVFTAHKSFRNFWIAFQDTIICAQNICTAADSFGLGSVYVGTVLECFIELIELFELPKGVFPVVLLSLGYPQSKTPKSNRLDKNYVIHNEKYNYINDEDLLKGFNEKHNRTFEITEERMEIIEKVFKEVNGEVFTNKSLNKIKENGYINMAQKYFGLHYPANLMPKDNLKYMSILEESGFGWFKKYNSFASLIIDKVK